MAADQSEFSSMNKGIMSAVLPPRSDRADGTVEAMYTPSVAAFPTCVESY